MVQLNKLQVLSTIYIRVFIFILTVIVVFASCIPYPGNIDEAEDSGYVIVIRNFSEMSYIGFTFYKGAIDTNNNFIALDSIVYDDITIPDKNLGDTMLNDGTKYSILRPFDIRSEKLTKFNTWAPPNYKEVNAISPEKRVSLRFLLHGNQKNIIITPNGVGYFSFDILEDGTLR